MSETLPVVEPPSDPGSSADRRESPGVAGVLLAAGASERFDGGDKLLAELDGEPLVTHAARTLTAAGLDPVVAVVPGDPDRRRAAIRATGATAIENPDAASGRASSVARGVAAVEGHDAAVLALGDMPRVRPATVGMLVAAYRAGAGSALAAGCDGRRGNPVLFDAAHFDALAALEGAAGGRDVLLSIDDAAVVETDDPGVLVDVDTVADLEALR